MPDDINRILAEVQRTNAQRTADAEKRDRDTAEELWRLRVRVSSLERENDTLRISRDEVACKAFQECKAQYHEFSLADGAKIREQEVEILYWKTECSRLTEERDRMRGTIAFLLGDKRDMLDEEFHKWLQTVA